MHTERGLERLVAFADAVVAIAMTLLVLPLVDLVGDIDRDTSLGRVVVDNQLALISFGISFSVIWALWRAHGRLAETLAGYDDRLVGLHFVWLFTIVALPFVTQLIDTPVEVSGARPLYVATLLLSVLSLAGMGWWTRRHPHLLREDAELKPWAGIGTVILLTVILVITLVAPALGLWPMFLLLLTRPVERLLERRYA